MWAIEALYQHTILVRKAGLPLLGWYYSRDFLCAGKLLDFLGFQVRQSHDGFFLPFFHQHR